MEDFVQSAIDENPDTAEPRLDSPDVAVPTETPDVTSLVAERDALARDKAELQERVMRLQADFDNFRKRTERERIEFAEYAGEQTVRELLPVLDDFERAMNAAEQHATASEDFIKGFRLIHTRLLDNLRKQGVEPIETSGAIFDPHQHEAVQRVESDEHEEGTIVRELQRGYTYRGRLLRPSMVQVAVKP